MIGMLFKYYTRKAMGEYNMKNTYFRCQITSRNDSSESYKPLQPVATPFCTLSYLHFFLDKNMVTYLDIKSFRWLHE